MFTVAPCFWPCQGRAVALIAPVGAAGAVGAGAAWLRHAGHRRGVAGASVAPHVHAGAVCTPAGSASRWGSCPRGAYHRRHVRVPFRWCPPTVAPAGSAVMFSGELSGTDRCQRRPSACRSAPCPCTTLVTGEVLRGVGRAHAHGGGRCTPAGSASRPSVARGVYHCRHIRRSVLRGCPQGPPSRPASQAAAGEGRAVGWTDRAGPFVEPGASGAVSPVLAHARSPARLS